MGKQMTADEIIDQFERKPFFFYCDRGITAGRVENPCYSLTFLTELLMKAKEKGDSHLSGYIRNYVSKETYRNRLYQ